MVGAGAINVIAAVGAGAMNCYASVEDGALNRNAEVTVGAGVTNSNIVTTSISDSPSEDQSLSTLTKKVMKCVLVALSFIALVFYVVSYIIFSDHFESSFKFKIVGEIYIWESIKFGLYLPQCIFITFSIFSWKASSSCRLYWTIPFTTIDYFLLGLNVVVYFYYLIRFFCAFTLLIYSDHPSDIGDRPTNGEVVAILLFTIFGILQVYAQSRYLLMANSQQESGVNIGNIHRYVLLYTVLLTGVASHTKPGHLIELKYVLILQIYRALDKNDSFIIV